MESTLEPREQLVEQLQRLSRRKAGSWDQAKADACRDAAALIGEDAATLEEQRQLIMQQQELIAVLLEQPKRMEVIETLLEQIHALVSTIH